MAADYSYLSVTTAQMVAAASRRGLALPDEAMLEAAQRIVPPLLPPVLMTALECELDYAQRRRGRRRTGLPTRCGLIARLRRISREDVPHAFIGALILRLEKGRRLPGIVLASRTQAILDRRTTKMFIRGLYRDFKELIGDEQHVVHPVLGRIELPLRKGSKSVRAIALTAYAMREFLDESPPSPATMMNIVSSNLHRKRE